MAEGWSVQIDAYCERVGFGFWAEPLNAVTNAAFLIAAAVAGWALYRRGRLEPGSSVLLALLVAIGVGSFLFHTVATRWAALADTLPIGLFIVAYLMLTLQRGFRLGWGIAIPAGIAFVPLAGALGYGIAFWTGGLFGGSSAYMPALLVLVVCALLLLRIHPGVARNLLIAAGLFVASLTFRTLDAPLCGSVPFGTHFMWHVLNATLLGLLIWTMGQMTAEPGDRRRSHSA